MLRDELQVPSAECGSALPVVLPPQRLLVMWSSQHPKKMCGCSFAQNVEEASYQPGEPSPAPVSLPVDQPVDYPCAFPVDDT